MLVRHKEPILEVVLLSVLGPLFGVYNPHQLAEVLGLNAATLYRRVHALTPELWKRLIQKMGYQVAIERLQVLSHQSPATISRAKVAMVLDDSLFVRLSQKLSYVWKWWGGALRRVGKGQNVIGLILVIGEEIIPLDLHIASKQGRKKKDKVTLACEMLELLAQRLQAAGIDLGTIRVVADSWYSCSELMDKAHSLGLMWTSEGKGSFVFEVDGRRLKGSQIKEKDLTQGWEFLRAFS